MENSEKKIHKLAGHAPSRRFYFLLYRDPKRVVETQKPSHEQCTFGTNDRVYRGVDPTMQSYNPFCGLTSDIKKS